MSACMPKIYRLEGAKYGILPEREMRSEPVEEVAVDLTGSWIFRLRCRPQTFNALTVVDTAINLVDIVRPDRKTNTHIMHAKNTS